MKNNTSHFADLCNRQKKMPKKSEQKPEGITSKEIINWTVLILCSPLAKFIVDFIVKHL